MADVLMLHGIWSKKRFLCKLEMFLCSCLVYYNNFLIFYVLHGNVHLWLYGVRLFNSMPRRPVMAGYGRRGLEKTLLKSYMDVRTISCPV